MSPHKRFLSIFTLMVVGEAVFLMPFVLSRIFRPTFLKVFDLTNFELGSAFSVYGVVAMVSYFLGGPIADRFSAKKLLIVALGVTLVSGFFMVTIPSLQQLTILYGFWGMSTILLFWSAFTKMTRLVGGEDAQGTTFGSVDAGRGLFAALLASVTVYFFTFFLPTDPRDASIQELTNSLVMVIYVFSGLIAVGMFLVWLALPNIGSEIKSQRFVWRDIKVLLGKKSIWLQALIIMCAYVGYKCTDVFSLYASDVMGFNDVQSARVGTISFWARPIAAVMAGFLGDRYQISKLTLVCFLVVILGSLVISTGALVMSEEIFVFISIAMLSAGIYGVRGIYYALMEEGNIPYKLTGSAVGLVAVIGYTPDIFMGPLIGIVLDGNPGELGHQYLFGILAIFGLVGLVCTLIFRRLPSTTQPV